MRAIPFGAARLLTALAASALIGAPHHLHAGPEGAKPADSKPPASKPIESSSPHVFLGWVSGPDQKPVTKARITIVATPKNSDGSGSIIGRLSRRYASGPTLEDKPVFYSAVSDEQGTFKIELPSSGPWNVRVEADGLAPAVLERANVSAASSSISLQTGSAVRGSVYDASRKIPLEGAQIAARSRVDRGFNDPSDPGRFCQRATAGQDGSFVVTNLFPTYYDLEITAAGHALQLVQNVSAESAGSEPVIAYLAPGFSVSGRVADGAGKGIGGVVLTADVDYRLASSARELSGALATLSTKTDDKGRFRMDGLPQTGGLGLVIASDGAYNRRPLEEPSGRSLISNVEIVLDRSSALRGRLVNSDGPPPRKASLTVQSQKTDTIGAPSYRRTIPDLKLGEKGEFSVNGLPPGNYRIGIRADGFKTPDPATAFLEAGKTADLVAIVLERGRTVRGRVTAADSTPIAKATVISYGGDGSVTEADGTYLLGGLPDRPSTLEVRAEGYGTQTMENVQPDSVGIDFVLSPAGVVSGRVVAGDPPKPVASYQMDALPKRSEDPMFGSFHADTRVFSDPSGRFTLSGLEKGEYTLEVRATGFAPCLREGVSVKEGEVNSLGDLLLSPGATARGRVVDREGSPLAGASVHVRSGGLLGADHYALAAGKTGVSLTDPAGRFAIRGLSPGSQTLVAAHPDYARAEVTIRAELGVDGEDVTLTLGKGGRITGTVRDAEGHFVQGASVGAVALTDPFERDQPIKTDERGRYTIEKLQPGSLTVWCHLPGEVARTPGGSESAKEAVVKEGETTVVDFGGEKRIRVSGTVKRKDGPAKDATLVFVPAEIERMISNMPRDVRTRDDGGYEVALAEAGKFIVTISAGDQGAGRKTSFDVQVPDQSEFHRDFIVSEGGISGTIVADADGKPLPGAKAMAFLMRESNSGGSSSAAPAADPARQLIPRPSGEAVTGADGRYSMEGLGAGTYRVIVTKQGFAPDEIEGLVLKADGSLTADAHLRPGKKLVVRITDADGRPVSGAIVGLLGSDGLPVPWDSGPGTFTGKDGAVTFDNVREESYTLFAFTRSMALGVLRDVSVSSDEETTERMRMTAGGSLSVKCADADGNPIAGCSVSLVEPAGIDLGPYLPLMRLFEGLPAVSGPDGVFSFPRLAPGRYRVTAVAPSGSRAEGSADINEGDAATLALKLKNK